MNSIAAIRQLPMEIERERERSENAKTFARKEHLLLCGVNFILQPAK